MPTTSDSEKPRAKSPKSEGANADGNPAHPNTPDPLLASICHDLRAPLAAVTMGANFVLQTLPESDQSGRQRRILEAMLRSCTQMERLVRNFGDLSEIESGAVVLRLGTHDAGELLELTVTAAVEKASEKQQSIEIEKPNIPVSIRCDRDRILRALGHLIENAIKFAPASTSLEVSVTANGPLASFSVVDHGPGIPREVEGFLDPKHTHDHPARIGKGFGLAIARGFARAHEGNVEVDSIPDTQTTFTLILPLEGPREAGEPVPGSARAFPVRNGGGNEARHAKASHTKKPGSPKRRSPS